MTMYDKKFTDEEIIKANDILDRIDFFNQRAGRELWNEKPVEIQDADIRNREEDIKFLSDIDLSNFAAADKSRGNR